MENKWYDKTAGETVAILSSDLKNGLDKKTVEYVRKRTGKNDIYKSGTATFFDYIKSMTFDMSSLLLIFTAIISAVFNSAVNATLTIFIVFFNYLAVTLLFIHSRYSFENVSTLSLPMAKVLRDGTVFLMRYDKLVPGDIILLNIGDIVPADCRLIESNNLILNESILTGNSVAVKKNAGFISNDDIPYSRQQCIVFACTQVISGSGSAIVTGIGKDTAVSALSKNPGVLKHFDLKIIDSLKRFSRYYSLATIAMVVLFTVINLFTKANPDGLMSVFMSGLSLSVSTMSEYFPAFGCIIIALSLDMIVKRRYKKGRVGAVVKNISKLDTISKVDTVIVPDSGVVSVHTPRISGAFVNRNLYMFDDDDFNPSLISGFSDKVVLSSGFIKTKNKKGNSISSEEQESIEVFSGEMHINVPALYKNNKVLDYKPGNAGGFDTVLIEENGEYRRYVRGDFDKLFGYCRYYRDSSGTHLLNSDSIKEITRHAVQAYSKLFKVTAIISDNSKYSTLTRFIPYSNLTVFEGFYLSFEPPLPGIVTSIDDLKRAGKRVIMISDETSTASKQLAKSVGIYTHDSETGDSETLRRYSSGDLNGLDKISFYENLSVNDREFLLAILRAKGHTVAYLGKTLEEIELMRESDVSLSLGLSFYDRAVRNSLDITSNVKLAGKKANDTLRHSSDVLVSEGMRDGRGGFNSVYSTLRQGRGIFLNLKFLIRYLTCSQILKIFAVLCSVLLGVNVLSPTKLLFLGLVLDLLFIISIAVRSIGKEAFAFNITDTEEYLNKPFKKNIIPVIISALSAIVIVTVPFLLFNLGKIFDSSSISSFVFISIIFSQFLIYYEMSFEKSERKKVHKLGFFFIPMLILAVLFTVLCIVFVPFGAFFGIVSVTYTELGICAAILLFEFVVFSIYRRVFY